MNLLFAAALLVATLGDKELPPNYFYSSDKAFLLPFVALLNARVVVVHGVASPAFVRLPLLVADGFCP